VTYLLHVVLHSTLEDIHRQVVSNHANDRTALGVRDTIEHFTFSTSARVSVDTKRQTARHASVSILI
jgi:hypothetical protein